MSVYSCKYFRAWVETSRGGLIDDACVDNEKRTIKHCDHLHNAEECPCFKELEDKS